MSRSMSILVKCKHCRGTGELLCPFPPDDHVAGLLECIFCNTRGRVWEYVDAPILSISGYNAQFVVTDDLGV